jgi:hypothetical protein
MAISDYIPGISTVKDAASGAANAVNTSAENTATVRKGPEETAQEATTLAKGIPSTTQAAQAGAARAAETEKDIKAPAGTAGMAAAQVQALQGLQLQEESQKAYLKSAQQITQLQAEAENALKMANAKADIDAQRYLKNMSVSDKTVTALGLFFGGAGAGMSRTSNPVADVLQKNIDRDIDEQKQDYANRMQIAAAQAGLLKTAQDKQQIDLMAQQYATITVNNGISNLLNSAQFKAQGAVAPDLVASVQNQLQQNALGALGAYNQNYINTYQAGDTKRLNLFGIGAETVAEKLSGGKGYGPINSNVGAADRAKGINTLPAAPPSALPKEAAPAQPMSEEDKRKEELKKRVSAPSFWESVGGLWK